MRRDEGRTVPLYFKVSPEEMGLIEKKMEQVGIRNKRAYLRKMAVDGYIVQLDMDGIRELNRLLCSVSNSVNQIARRCNETGNLYAEDVEDIRKGCAEVRLMFSRLCMKLSEL